VSERGAQRSPSALKHSSNPADNLISKRARLSNDELVEIEIVYNDGYARVIRIDGDRAGTKAVCQISKLEAENHRLGSLI